jgi:dihydrofolate reductase
MSMGKVGASFSMSLDGFIASPHDDMQRLFAWYFSDDTDLKASIGDEDVDLKLSSESTQSYEETIIATGAIVSGRRMLEVAGAWGGKHPLDVAIFVVTHTIPQEWVKEGSPFTFVTDGLESAIEQAQAVAEDKSAGIDGANIAQQCLNAGLLDEIQIDLVSVLLGDGIRLFEHLDAAPIELESTRMARDPGVIHLTFRVVKS